MVLKTGSYIGIGFGDVTSKGTDMIMCNSIGVGVGECTDMHSVWVDMASPPQKDTQQDLFTWFEAGSGAQEGLTIATMYRDLDTGDEHDFVIPLDTIFTVAWSIKEDGVELDGHHTQRAKDVTLHVPLSGAVTTFSYPTEVMVVQ